jgi:hypothetical protein
MLEISSFAEAYNSLYATRQVPREVEVPVSQVSSVKIVENYQQI